MSIAVDCGPGIFVPPPFVFVGGWVLAWACQWWLPFRIDGAGASLPQRAIGGLVALFGLGIMGWAMNAFRRANTPVVPVSPARVIVMDGPYQLTRNPMYVGITALYFGLAVMVNMGWPIVWLPVVLIVLSLTIIEREERYLHSAFGAHYDTCSARVRRWL